MRNSFFVFQKSLKNFFPLASKKTFDMGRKLLWAQTERQTDKQTERQRDKKI